MHGIIAIKIKLIVGSSNIPNGIMGIKLCGICSIFHIPIYYIRWKVWLFVIYNRFDGTPEARTMILVNVNMHLVPRAH